MQLIQTLVPVDEHDDSDVILEVVSGRTTGGDWDATQLLCDEIFNHAIVGFLLLTMTVCCFYQVTYANSSHARSLTCMKVLPATKTGTLMFLITLLQIMVHIICHTLGYCKPHSSHITHTFTQRHRTELALNANIIHILLWVVGHFLHSLISKNWIVTLFTSLYGSFLRGSTCAKILLLVLVNWPYQLKM